MRCVVRQANVSFCASPEKSGGNGSGNSENRSPSAFSESGTTKNIRSEPTAKTVPEPSFEASSALIVTDSSDPSRRKYRAAESRPDENSASRFGRTSRRWAECRAGAEIQKNRFGCPKVAMRFPSAERTILWLVNRYPSGAENVSAFRKTDSESGTNRSIAAGQKYSRTLRFK